ncbi:unnamed protein product (macronuclear) [Paramecium tetraurelia]|uniref:Uncharacterized protein n=1 Tax=Paramecium tetraurelia TaxID=5888 RepID=A0C0J6_PARTE|nr:uncharacterized protein GSPATT00006166001 [Paramecium tetraurelia]CAK64313.1 unnamed protein product [Paramecium tetraurelia]|eukprot:XP_001431711.1 hypothetical protein (macronuclear) [Paramecium tetraurelia strain d4-2]
MLNYTQSEEEINHPQYRTRVRYRDNAISRDLSGKLDVTCFLMVVEIQRLVAENTELKVQIKQHHDSGLDRINYEMQIRDLMEKLQRLQQDNQLIVTDNERLRKLIQDLEVSLSKYEIQFRDYDPNWKKELENQKKQLLQLQKKIGDEDIDDLKAQLNQMKRKLNDYDRQFDGKNPDELQRMLDELRRKAKLYDELQNKLGGINPDILAKKLKDLEKLQKQFGGSPEDLLKELEKLRKKAKEADELKKELDRQQRENDKQRGDLGMLDDLQKTSQDLQFANGQLNQQLNDLRNKLKDLEGIKNELNQLRDSTKKKDQEIASLKMQLNDAQKQISDLQKQVQDQTRLLNEIQYKYRQAEQDKMKLQKDLQNCLEELDSADGQKDVAEQLKDDNEKLNQEVDQLHEENDKLQNENEDLKNRLNDLLRQIQDKDNKLKDLQTDLNKKNQELKDFSNKLKEANDKIQWIKNEFGLTDDDLDPKKRKSNKNNQETRLFANIQPSNMLINYLLLSTENERLGIIIDKQYGQIESLQNQVNAYKQKNEQITQQLQQQLILQSQMKMDNEIEKLKEYYENKIVMLTMELSRLRQQQTSSYQSISTLQTRITSQPNGKLYDSTTIQPKREEELLSLLVLMAAEVQNLRDQNSSLLLRQNDTEINKGLLSKSSNRVIVEQLNLYEDQSNLEQSKNYFINTHKEANKEYQVNYKYSTQIKNNTYNEQYQNIVSPDDRVNSLQGDISSQRSYQYQSQIPYKFDQNSQQLNGSGVLKVQKYETSRYVN